MKTKKTPKKNYILVLAMKIIIIIICLVITKINFDYQDNKIKKSPLVKIVEEYKYEDLNKIIKKENKNLFIYLSYTNDFLTHELENNLKKIIEDKNLKEDFIYINLKKHDKKIVNELNDFFKLSDNKIESLPSLIYYRDNGVKKVITSGEKPFNSGEFNQLLDIYEIVK